MKYNAETYSVTRADSSTVLTTILFDENDNTFRFVNLIRNHICPCKFKSIDDALEDLNSKVKSGNVLHYEKIG